MESEPNNPQPQEPGTPEEPKSTKTTKKGVVLKSRGQILSEYGLSLITFEDLYSRSLLNGDMIRQRGKNFIEVGAHNDFVFRCAKNDIASFRQQGKKESRPLPYHRFLTLRFVNTSPSETYDELVSHGVINPDTIKRPTLAKYYAQYVRKVPIEIRRFVIAKEEPISKEDRRLFRLFLKVLNIHIFYDEPELIDDLAYLLKEKFTLEPLIATTAVAEDVAEAMGKLAGYDIPPLAIAAYRNLLFAVHELAEDDLKEYFRVIPAVNAHYLKKAYRCKLPEFAAKQGIEDLCEHAKVLGILRMTSQKSLFRTFRLMTDIGIQKAKADLDTYLKVSDRLDVLGAGRVSPVKIFDRFIVKNAGAENGPLLIAPVLETEKLLKAPEDAPKKGPEDK